MNCLVVSSLAIKSILFSVYGISAYQVLSSVIAVRASVNPKLTSACQDGSSAIAVGVSAHLKLVSANQVLSSVTADEVSADQD